MANKKENANKGYRTVFGMEKIDQGRHEGALTTTTSATRD